MPPTIPSNQTLPLRSYGRRKGHALSARQLRLVDDLLPKLAVDAATLGDPTALFDPPADELWLEIGFGGGEHLLAQALANPRIGFIGAEPYLNGMASLLGQIETRGLTSIRLHHGDARELLDALPGASLGRAYVLFPDPWPKARHAKRRLLGPETVSALARVMRAGAELRFASDIPDTVDFARASLLGSGAFEERVADGDWPQTRYEAKAIRAGRLPQKFVFVKL